jgi:hypothetical protein
MVLKSACLKFHVQIKNGISKFQGYFTLKKTKNYVHQRHQSQIEILRPRNTPNKKKPTGNNGGLTLKSHASTNKERRRR